MTEQKILVVIDKDGTLVEPESGATFPQSPTDQKLMQGVPEALAMLKGDRYSLAIASNQGGCDVFTAQASQIKVGNYIVHGKDDRYKVVQIDVTSDDGLIFRYDRERPNGAEYSFSFPDSDIRIAYKTIGDAVEEVCFAADLCGIDDAIFCPSMDGTKAIEIIKSQRDNQWHHGFVRELLADRCLNQFRKPGPGMLLFAGMDRDYADRIMIGDRPEDRAAADAAGFIFLDAAEWRSGVTVEQAIERASSVLQFDAADK